jgi:hypothetical protein
MTYKDLLAKATPGIAVVRLGQLAPVAGETYIHDALECSPDCLSHSHLPVAIFRTMSDLGEPMAKRHEERVANARLYAHCRNKFTSALNALKEARQDLIDAGAKHEAKRLISVIEELETV